MTAIETKIKNGGFKEKNYPFMIFLGLILICLIALISNILRHFEMIFNPLFGKEPDLGFYLYIMAIIIGWLTIYKLVRYYFEYGSIDYLLVGLFVFATVTFFYSWQLWTEYISTIISNLRATGDLQTWSSDVKPEFYVANPIFWLGCIVLLIFAFRLKSWQEQHLVIKVLFIISFINGILIFFRAVIFAIIYPSFPLVIENTWFVTYSDLIRNFPLLFVESVPKIYTILFYPLFISYYLLIIVLLTTFPSGKSKIITYARYYWILFMLVQIFGNVYKTLSNEPYFLMAEYLVIFQVFFTGGLLILLYLGPETLFLTDQVLFKANKIYTVFDKKSKEEKKTEEEQKGILHWFTGYQEGHNERLRQYIESIPKDIIQKSKITVNE
jgi:hypothetical protein